MNESGVSDTATPHGGRHFGLDWLRIAAFALLILYHIGMVFAPWHWVIDTQRSYPALIPPMAMLTPWRLSLLFAVSGYASRMLFARSDSGGAFARSRNLRLLVPLAFGMVMLVPIEMYIQVLARGYPHGYWTFWTRDYWRIGAFYGREFPSWEHLWFVVYLWAYTMVTLVLARLGRLPGAAVSAWLGQGLRILWAPVLVMGVLRLSLLFVVPEKQGLFTDWAGHVSYFPMFLFGFTLAAQPALWRPIARHWPLALVAALVCGGGIVAAEMTWQGDAIPPHLAMAAERGADVAMGWTMTLVLFHLADRFWNRDHRWRRTLSEAVFPFYLIHHVAIIFFAWETLPLGLDPWVEFAILLGATAASCAIFYLVGRRIGWLRPLIGLGAISGRADQPPTRSISAPTA
ncbi:acyltransferase family protein [Sphingomonas sp.]|uniref:acyltransferase family protein n=1 Tax=Sphingomonas sp. TaxID=28214 RepID=UPI002D141E87|nr:acyltransferase family protein [Sphingomonas sp.]HTG39836.1 acyltransferase family protein [Sphingomonas sp.]